MYQCPDCKRTASSELFVQHADDCPRWYQFVKKIADKRFGSECKHERVINGTCTNCLRKVVSR